MSRAETIASHIVNLRNALSKYYPGYRAGFSERGLVAISLSHQEVEQKLLETGSIDYTIIKIEKADKHLG